MMVCGVRTDLSKFTDGLTLQTRVKDTNLGLAHGCRELLALLPMLGMQR